MNAVRRVGENGGSTVREYSLVRIFLEMCYIFILRILKARQLNCIATVQSHNINDVRKILFIPFYAPCVSPMSLSHTHTHTRARQKRHRLPALLHKHFKTFPKQRNSNSSPSRHIKHPGGYDVSPQSLRDKLSPAPALPHNHQTDDRGQLCET